MIHKTILLVIFFLLSASGIVTPNNSSVDYRQIGDLINGGKTADAEAILKKYISENENDYIAITMLGNVYREKGDRKTALRYYDAALKINPDYPKAHLLLGKLYFIMQDNDKAVGEFNAFKYKMGPSSEMNTETKKLYINALHYFSEIYFTLKRYDDAKKEIDEIIVMDPKNQTALYNLGIYYYYAERNRAKAYELFKKAAGLERTSYIAKKADYAIEFMRNNPDPRISPDFSFLDKEK